MQPWMNHLSNPCTQFFLLNLQLVLVTTGLQTLCFEILSASENPTSYIHHKSESLINLTLLPPSLSQVIILL